MLLTNEAADQPGDEQSIYNESTNELFTYHYDRQKGVGKKYNLSSGFVRSTRKDLIKEYKDLFLDTVTTKFCSNLATNSTDTSTNVTGLTSGVVGMSRGLRLASTTSLWHAYYRILSMHMRTFAGVLVLQRILKICAVNYLMTFMPIH